MIFDKELSDYLHNYRWSSVLERSSINDEEFNQILMIMMRVSESYDCSISSGFTSCEYALSELLIRFYNAGVKRGEEHAKRQMIWKLQESLQK